jgi:hypothetical protein
LIVVTRNNYGRHKISITLNQEKRFTVKNIGVWWHYRCIQNVVIVLIHSTCMEKVNIGTESEKVSRQL